MHESVDQLLGKVTSYIMRLFSGGNLTETQSEQVAGLLSVANNMQRITERCGDISEVTSSMQTEGKTLSEDAAGEMKHCFELLQRLFNQSIAAVRDGNEDVVMQVARDKNKMRKAKKQFNKAHLARVKKQICDPSMTADFSGILYNMDRIADNCVGIAEEAMDHVTFINLEAMQMEPQEIDV